MRRDVFQAIADPIRREIIELLAEETLTVNAIAEKFEISRPAISKHLKILKECEIIDYRQEGRTRHCFIQAQNLIPAYMWIEQYQKLWEDKLDSFDQYLSKLQSERKIERNE
ncbi:MAG: metalloregulator ArsR/SmtB family transcription factor [Saprospiraceae bacterium]